MTEHYPKSTISVSAFCRKCQKQTQHRVDDVRLGPCLVCIEKLREQSVRLEIERERAAKQGMLWGDAL